MRGGAVVDRRQSRRSRWIWDLLSSRSAAVDRMNEPVRRLAIEHLDLKAGERVLDLGCGTGPNFAPLREAVGLEGRVAGIDFSPKMAQRARERIREHGWDNVEVMCADAARIEIEPGSYDAAIATFTLSAITDVGAAVANVCAALRPGGRFFVCDLRLVPGGRAAIGIWLLGVVYKLIAGWSGRDVLAQLQATFPSVDLVLPLRPWPPVVLAVARKADAATAHG